MTHSSRFNFKAKSAKTGSVLSDKDAIRDRLLQVVPHVDQQLKATTEIHGRAVDLAELVTLGTTYLDENVKIGNETFELVKIEADSVLADLPVKKILTRACQVISLLGQRLEVALSELHLRDAALRDLMSHAEHVSASTASIQASLANTTLIGRRPRSAEIDDLEALANDNRMYRRHGVDVESDVSDVESDGEYEANGTAGENPLDALRDYDLDD
jgi:hypothetical protein